MQKLLYGRPLYVNTDNEELLLKSGESRYLKNYRINFNVGIGTPLQSTAAAAPSLTLPAGFNKNVGSFECKELNKLFYFNYNSNGFHGVYLLDGVTMQPQIVLVDPLLDFSLDPENFIAEHRVSVHVVYDSDGSGARRIKEVYLKWTEGRAWQRWIDVLAAIGSNGFDDVTYPYWKVFAPHFDRQALIDWPTRPPMKCPTIKALDPDPNTGKHNNLLKKSLRFSYRFNYTDGRTTTFSPRSAPFELLNAACQINVHALSRCIELTLDAGGPQVESVDIIFSESGGDWYKVDTVRKYTNTGVNDPALIGDNYWLRTQPFQPFGYSPSDNTFRYVCCMDKEFELISQEDAIQFATDIPIASVAQAAAGDCVLLGNNLYDYDNFTGSVLDKFKLKVDQPVPLACAPKLRRLKLHSFVCSNRFAPSWVWKRGATGQPHFGVVQHTDIPSGRWPDQCDRAAALDYRLGDKEGFIMYLAGTPYYAVGRQFKVDRNFQNKTYVGVIDMEDANQRDMVYNHINNMGFFVQEYEFYVPSGVYIGRLANHVESVDSANFRATSTYVAGVAGWNPSTVQITFAGGFQSGRHELSCDTIYGDFDSLTYADGILKVQTLSAGGGPFRVFAGYIKESAANQIGIEKLSYRSTITPVLGDFAYSGGNTDHNGFYWYVYAPDQNMSLNNTIEFLGYWNCNPNHPPIFDIQGLPQGTGIFWGHDVTVKERLGSFEPQNRIIIRGTITDCDGKPLPGVAVTLKQGMTAYSAVDGKYEIVAHAGRDYDSIVFNSASICTIQECDCSPLGVSSYYENLVPCAIGVQRVYPQTVDRVFRLLGATARSLKSGGRYAVGIVGFDLAGRPTYVNRIGYLDIPTFMETKVYEPASASWFVSSVPTFPAHVKWMSLFITKNMNVSSYLQWVGDKIEFLDINGNVIGGGATAGAVRARITIQSLNDFNVQNNFATTAKYQFVQGDVVRIMDDGDGNVFDPALTQGFLDYQVLGTNWDEAQATTGGSQQGGGAVQNGKSFIINFDSRLAALVDKKGFWIEIMRPREYNEKQLFFEVCGTYPVVNRQPTVIAGPINAWDTYYQRRLMKIDGAQGKSFDHPFESIPVSDFWGENVETLGRPLTADDKVEQKWYGDNIIRSDDLVNDGKVNGLGTFREKNKKAFKGNDLAGIVAMHAERSMVAVIGQNDWFLTDYQMNYARVTKDGLLAVNLDSALSDPHQKVGSNYGCLYEHTASIVFEDGIAIWGCGQEGGIILMDYHTATNIANIDNTNYLIDKWKFVIGFNKSLPQSQYLRRLIDVVAGYDPKHGEYLITFRPRRNLSQLATGFVNNQRGIRLDFQETFVFDISMKKWVRWAGYTPESFGKLRHATSGIELVSFASGAPYLHNSQGPSTYNVFYGVPTDQVIDATFNFDEEKPDNRNVLLFQSMGFSSGDMKYFADRIFTNEAGSFSYVPISYVKRKENVHYAELLRDMNTVPPTDPALQYRSMLIDGKRLFGPWMRMRLVRDPQRRSDYSEIGDIHVRVTLSPKTNK